MSKFNAMQEDFEEVTILDMPALFTPIRIDRNTVPCGYHLYEVRHDDDCQGDAVQIARGIMVNHWGTLITRDEIKLPSDGYLDIEPDALNHGTGDCRSMKGFMDKYPSATKIPTREDIIAKVLLMGVTSPESTKQDSERSIALIASFYNKNHPSKTQFSEFIEKAYGWKYGVCVLDDRTPFVPHDFHYNHAGLQYKYRGEDKIINLECLKWDDVAKRIAKMIDEGKYGTSPVKKRTEQIR